MALNEIFEEEPTPQEMARYINLLLRGRSNSTGSFTLTADTTATSVTDLAFESQMVPLLIPTTANASAEQPYVSTRTNQSFTVTHADNAQTDRTYLYVKFG